MSNSSFIPFPHQLSNARFMYERKRCILGDDLGLGKSASSILALKYLRSHRILIVCPASLKRNWLNEFRIWYPACPFTILEGISSKRKAQMGRFLDVEGVLCVNYEQIRAKHDKKSDGTNKQRSYLMSEDLKAVASLGFQTLICDEAHQIRSRHSLSFIGTRWLARQIENVFLLTGTPIVNRVSDLWSLLHLIDREKYSSYWDFVKHPIYGCEVGWNAFGNMTVAGSSKNPEALKREIAPIFIRRLKEDVLPDLPDKTYQRVWVDLAPSEQKVYSQMESEWLAWLKGGQEVAAPVIISQITRLKQFCISPDLAVMPLEDGEKFGHGFNTTKFKVLQELIESTDQKIIVFSQFEKAVTLGCAMCEAVGVKAVRHTGKESHKERDDALREWRCNPDCRVCFLTIASGSVGLNLVEASICVFMDKVWTNASNEQAANRLHRPGQKSAVTIYEILVRKSIEEWLIEEKLNGKIKLTEEIIAMAERRVKEVQR